MPQKTWAVGEEVLAADFNSFVQQQVVATFANPAARDTWASPPNGALCVTIDTYTVWMRRVGVWEPAQAGLSWYTANVSGQAGIGLTPTDIAGTTITFTAVSGHRYHFQYWCLASQTLAGLMNVQVDVNGTTYGLAAVQVPSNAAQILVTSSFAIQLSGAVTAKMKAAAGNGTMSIVAATGYPCNLLIRDLGNI